MEKIKKDLYGIGIIFIAFLTIFIISLTYGEIQKNSYLGLNQPRSIDISAEEIIYQKPDEAKITFSVLTQAETYDQATEINNQQMERVNSYLKEEGIEEKNLKTQNFSVRPRYEYIEDRYTSQREIVGYEVENNLQVTVINLEKIDALIGGAIEAGANKVSGLVFEVSNREELEDQAKLKAIEKAKENAEEIADSLGVKVGRILAFSESGGYSPIRYNYEEMAADSMGRGGAAPIEEGESEISSSVNITFEIK
jgi:uncharacterized protein YggE